MKVECEICKDRFKLITIAHLAKHGITSIKEYQEMFPSAEIFSEEYRDKRRKLAKIQFKKQWEKDFFNMYSKVHSRKSIEKRKSSLKKYYEREGDKNVD